MSLKLMYITNNPNVALIAERNGVQRIWIDLETLGKEERQKNMNTVKSKHTVEDIKRIAPLLTISELMVRVNPWNVDSEAEINDVINAGAQIIMLPMWKTAEEVQNFVNTVSGRAKAVLLLETKEADECLDDVLKIKGIDEIHIGLNDLHISYGRTFMFELLSDGTVERICKKIADSHIPYGFGGIASIGCGAVPAERIVLEHYRLGSTGAILSRSFCDYAKIDDLIEIERTFCMNMEKLREFEKYAETVTEDVFIKNKEMLKHAVDIVVKKMVVNKNEK